MVFLELLLRNQTINSDVYCRQLNKLNAAVKEKRQKLLRLGWEEMLYPPYGPDLAPSDYYIFRSLQNSLNGKTFNNDETVKSHLVHFFADKNRKFYERGIMELPGRCKRSLNKMENISLIKVSSLYLKKYV